jgi:hypothetical protein
MSTSMTQIERYLTLIIRPEMRAFSKVERYLTCFTTTWATTTTWAIQGQSLQVRRQRQQQQQSHSSIMWCISKLDFMIISLRAKSKSNKKHSSKRVHLLRYCTFRLFVLTCLRSHDINNNYLINKDSITRLAACKRWFSTSLYTLQRMLLIWFWFRSKRDNHKI